MSKPSKKDTEKYLKGLKKGADDAVKGKKSDLSALSEGHYGNGYMKGYSAGQNAKR